MIRDGLDWLLASANGTPRTLVQFHDGGEGADLYKRPPLKPEAARAALQDLLQLRAQGLAEPLPWGPYTGWTYYSESSAAKPEAALEKARKQWQGGHQSWGEGGGDAFRLTLRGRDLFDDDEVFRRFREVNARIFRALVEGIVFDGFVDDALADRGEATA